MSALKITEGAGLEWRNQRARNHAFEALARLLNESSEHRVCGFTQGNDQHTVVGVEVVEVFGNAEDSAIAVHVAREGLFYAGFGQCVFEQAPRDFFHDAMSRVSRIQVSMASRISRRRPSKKWSALSIITSFFGSAAWRASSSSRLRCAN